MLTISTNTSNRIYVDSSGNIATSSNIEAISDIAKNKVLTTLGEPQYNITDGIPYFETVFCDYPNPDLFQAAVIQAIEEIENVEKVVDFEYDDNNGVLSYSLTIETSYGDIKLNG